MFRIIYFILVFCFFATSLFSQIKVNHRYKFTNEGIGYKIIKKGKGEKIKKSQRVHITFSFYHLSDSGLLKPILVNSNKNFLIGHEEVLPGWDIGISLLKLGDSAVFKIPPKLAYGDKKIGKIPKNAIFFLFVKIDKLETVFFQHQNLDTLYYNSGLKKIKVKNGNGKKSKLYSEIKVNFTGYVYSKKGYPQIFESTNSNNLQVNLQLGVGKLVKGLDEGILTMEIGEKATFIIPPHLGFGEIQNGKILPNTTLIYDIELVSSDYPFLTYNSTNIIKTKDSLFVYKLSKGPNNGLPITTETYATYNYRAYYKLNDSCNIIFDDNFSTKTPIIHRPGIVIGFPGIEKGLVYLNDKDTATIRIPNSKLINKNKLDFLPEGNDVFIDLYILKVDPYPFLTINSKDTIKNPSGLIYLEDIKSVKGVTFDTIKLGTVLNAYYTISFLDSLGNKKILDCTRDQGSPLNVTVGNGKNIKGFEEGLIGMLNRSSRRLIVPPHLAYGDDAFKKYGVPFKSNLIIDIEYVEILKK